MLTKRCSKCGDVKAVELFRQSRGVCKACHCGHSRRHYAENKDLVLEQKRRYHAKNKEARAERARRWLTENKDAIVQQRRRYRAENKDAEAERIRRYRGENKDAIAEQQRRRRGELKPAYVKGLLIKQMGVSEQSIDPVIVELKRNELALSRSANIVRKHLKGTQK